MIRRLGHLCLVTDDLQRMAEFYTGLLGLPVKFEFRNAAGELFGYYFDCGDCSFIEVFDRIGRQKQWGGKLEPMENGNRYSHFCLEVTGLRDLKTALEKKGLKVTEVRTGMDRSIQAWTNDPDGNAVELMEYTGQSLQLQRPAAGVVNVASPPK